MARSLNYWKGWLHPTKPSDVTIEELHLFGSDLHERGIGAVKVKFHKPVNTHSKFPEAEVIAVLKPDDRGIEKSMFGSQETSLAQRLNKGFYAYDKKLGQEVIPTIKMKTHATHGAFIQFIQGTPAEEFKGKEKVSRSMIEAIAFSFITGLGDLHRENILWNHGKPYMIDADNALLNRLMEPPSDQKLRDIYSRQTGFTEYSEKAGEIANTMREVPTKSQSIIIQALLENSTPFIDAVKETFQGRKGRIVPLATRTWGGRLGAYAMWPAGQSTDAWATKSRWGLINKSVLELPDPKVSGTRGGEATFEPGLEGETGISNSGRTYRESVEKNQIKADFNSGQIPFYNYEYDTGHVLHNGYDIWHGKDVNEAMEVLVAKFPPP